MRMEGMTAGLMMLILSLLPVFAGEGDQQVQIEAKIVEVSHDFQDQGLDFHSAGSQEIELGAGAGADLNVARGIDRVAQIPHGGFGDQIGVTAIGSLEENGAVKVLTSPRVTTTELKPVTVKVDPIAALPETTIERPVLKQEPVIVPDSASMASMAVNLTAKPRGEVPVLRRIPGIGPLFRGRAERVRKAETVILLKPAIVDPVE